MLHPYIATTYEALCACLDGKVKIIYAFWWFYLPNKDVIERALAAYGYKISDIPARQGLFFVKEGESIEADEIYDPVDLF